MTPEQEIEELKRRLDGLIEAIRVYSLACVLETAGAGRGKDAIAFGLHERVFALKTKQAPE